METTNAARADLGVSEQFLYQTHLNSRAKMAKEKKKDRENVYMHEYMDISHMTLDLYL